MKTVIYIGKKEAETDPRTAMLMETLRSAGHETALMHPGDALPGNVDMVLSVGGDGTFLSTSMLVADSGVPVAGVNLGRLGFLSENRPEDVARAIVSGDYSLESRAILQTRLSSPVGNALIDAWPYALNEMTVHRSGAAMLGVDVSVDGVQLPTYWADGLVVSTSSGSTAYSLSVGGPIVLPESKVLIISPIAPHNLNVRPLIVPDTSEIRLRTHSRDAKLIFTADNRTAEVNTGTEVDVCLARFSLNRVRLNNSNFINALTEKLFWGEDVRNIK